MGKMASSALKTFKVMKPQWNFVRIQNLSQVVKPHVPQISFRKGGIIPKHAPEAAPIIAVQATGSQPKVINLEWWQTPEKFKRRKVDDSEIDIINSGGADRLY